MDVRFPAAALVLALAGCGGLAGGPRHASVEGAVMGTYYVFTARCTESDVAFKSAAKALAAVDAELSTYNPDSQLMRLNQTPVGKRLPATAGLWSVLLLANTVREQSGGAFDVSHPYRRSEPAHGSDLEHARLPDPLDRAEATGHAGNPA